jgi:hypothetical protein
MVQCKTESICIEAVSLINKVEQSKTRVASSRTVGATSGFADGNVAVHRVPDLQLPCHEAVCWNMQVRLSSTTT